MYEQIENHKNENRADLKISGSGCASGGSYNQVKISGSGEINGNIDCNEIKISGSAKINGDIKALNMNTSGSSKVSGNGEIEKVSISGSSEVTGNLKVKEIKTSGSMKIGESLTASEVEVSGSIKINGGIHSEKVNVSGDIYVGEDCETESFKTTGGFKINGLLNSDDINIEVYGDCKVREIGGEKIKVEKGRMRILSLGRLLKSMFSIDTKLETDLIEGNEISLECTKAKVVRGNNITIGEECDIDLIEYKDTLNIHPNAKVKEQRKI